MGGQQNNKSFVPELFECIDEDGDGSFYVARNQNRAEDIVCVEFVGWDGRPFFLKPNSPLISWPRSAEDMAKLKAHIQSNPIKPPPTRPADKETLQRCREWRLQEPKSKRQRTNRDCEPFKALENFKAERLKYPYLRFVDNVSGDQGIYTGKPRWGMRHGRGSMAYANGDRYDGEWTRNEPSGHGKFVSGDGLCEYEGDFFQGKYHGRGVYTVRNPDIVNARWRLLQRPLRGRRKGGD